MWTWLGWVTSEALSWTLQYILRLAGGALVLAEPGWVAWLQAPELALRGSSLCAVFKPEPGIHSGTYAEGSPEGEHLS